MPPSPSLVVPTSSATHAIDEPVGVTPTLLPVGPGGDPGAAAHVGNASEAQHDMGAGGGVGAYGERKTFKKKTRGTRGGRKNRIKKGNGFYESCLRRMIYES